MKNMLKKLIAISLACLMLLALVSCDKSSAVKKAMEKEEYTISTIDAKNDEAQALFVLMGMSEEQREKAAEYEIILCKKGLASAIVIKFPNDGDLKDFLTVEKDGEKNTAMYDKAKEEGKINGNCLLITASSATTDIFKKA